MTDPFVQPQHASVPAPAHNAYGAQAAAYNGPPARACYACHRPVLISAVVCPGCGSALAAPKSKGLAVLLAVFLSFWTWLYTYRRDAWKFWTGLGIGFLGLLLTIVLVGWAILLGVWMWAIIDTALKDERYYMQFPNA